MVMLDNLNKGLWGNMYIGKLGSFLKEYGVRKSNRFKEGVINRCGNL